jgi:hypothetical protein
MSHAETPILSCLERLHETFLSDVLPRARRHAQVYFRHLKCRHRLADAIQETVAVCWKWYLKLTEQGKDVSGFVTTLASYAARHVRSGRKLCGQEKAKDAMSPRAQQRKGFTVQSLPAYETGTEDNATIDALKDNTKTPPPDAAAFRIDYPAWLSRLGERNRRIAGDMALGERTKDLATKYGTTQGRVSQLRREFLDDWTRFTDAPVSC